MGRLIIDGNQVYELDEACLQAKAEEEYRKTAGDRQNNSAGIRQSGRNNGASTGRTGQNRRTVEGQRRQTAGKG